MADQIKNDKWGKKNKWKEKCKKPQEEKSEVSNDFVLNTHKEECFQFLKYSILNL